jgi:hypothetical protein
VVLLLIGVGLWLLLASSGTQEKSAQVDEANATTAQKTSDRTIDAKRLSIDREVDALVKEWIKACLNQDLSVLLKITSLPAAIDDHLVKDAAGLKKVYAELAKELAAQAKILQQAKPVVAEISRLEPRLPAIVRQLNLDADDVAVAMTHSEAKQRIILLIRRAPSVTIAGILR